MGQFDEIIRGINPYSQACRMLKDVEEIEITRANINNHSVPEINLWIVCDRRKDKCSYNIPTCNEVAVVFTLNDGEPPIGGDIYENCDPMIYPILFPPGECDRDMNLKQVDGAKKQSMLQFYMNRLAVRDTFNPCLKAGKLTQQYIVDAYVKVEAERLTYIRLNQPTLREELYSGLMDHMNNLADNEGGKAGTMIILPSSFQGGSRFMLKMYQNAMSIVKEFDRPNLFITVTCNPKLPERVEQLREGQSSADRPDIVAPVFNRQIKSMLNEILHDDIFEKVVAFIYVIEFQKRNLPHMHLLLTLDSKSKIRNNDEINEIVSAEIPDEDTEPELYQLVRTHMINENKCSKRNARKY